MTNETALAFDTLEARAVGMAGDPLDRIAVRDYPKTVEIGAFQAERGVEQRIQFNVVLEVSRHTAGQTDDVDKVLSYDTIIEAIETQLKMERINLLETLAERIAERVLQHGLAERVFVRIEKLDRIPGTLGCEIVRSRGAENGVHVDDVQPLVVFLPNSVMQSKDRADWLNAIAAHEVPAIICVEPVDMARPETGVAMIDRRLGLLSIEQNAWVLAGLDHRCVVVDSRTELDWAIKNGQLSVWAPSKVVMDAVDKPDVGAEDPLGLAQWFAKVFAADHVSVCGPYGAAHSGARLDVVQSPGAL